jgi:kinesin family protein C1
MLFTINYSVKMKDGSTRNGKLNICDLAGSERLSKSGTHHVGVSFRVDCRFQLLWRIANIAYFRCEQGALLEETKSINKSLSVLSNVIERLQAGDKNIPFRESKLTFLLQNSLSGNSKTLAIVCCNPLTSHFHESLCSLRFAEKVNKCELKAVNSFIC